MHSASASWARQHLVCFNLSCFRCLLLASLNIPRRWASVHNAVLIRKSYPSSLSAVAYNFKGLLLSYNKWNIDPTEVSRRAHVDLNMAKILSKSSKTCQTERCLWRKPLTALNVYIHCMLENYMYPCKLLISLQVTFISLNPVI